MPPRGELVGYAYVKVHADSSGMGNEIKRDMGKAAGEAGDQAGKDFGKGFDKSQKAELRKTVNSTRQALRFQGPAFTSTGDDWGSRLGRSMRQGLSKELAPLGQSLRNSLKRAVPPGLLRPAMIRFGDDAEEHGGRAGTRGGQGFSKGFSSALSKAFGPKMGLPFTRMRVPIAALLSALDPVIVALGSVGGAAMSLVGPLASAAQVAGAAAPILASVGIAGATVITAFSGMGAALKTQTVIWEKLSKGIKPTAEDLKNAEEAMKGLTPAAQNMVKAISGIFPELTKIRQVTQENFFRGLADQFSHLATQLIPVLNKGLADTANTMNQVAAAWMTTMSQLTTQGTIAAIFAGAQPILADLGSAFNSLFRSLVEFTGAAIPLAQQLTAEFSAWAASVQRAVTEGVKTGKISESLQQAKQDFDLLKDIIVNVGSALKTTFQIGSDTGRGFLGALAQVTQKWDEWTKTAQGATAIQKFFDSSKQAIDAFMPVVAALGTTLASMFSNPAAQAGFQALAKGMADLLPIVGQLFSALSNVGIINIVGQAMTALGQALAPLMPVLTQLAISVGSVLQGAFTAIAPLLPVLGEALVALGLAITPLVDALGGALTPILMAVVSAIIPLIPIVVQLAQAVGAILVPAVQAVTPLLIALAPLFTLLMSAAGPLIQILSMVANTVTSVLVPALQFVIGIIGNVIGWVSQAIVWLTNWRTALSQTQAAASAVFAAISATVSNWASNISGWLNTVVGWFNSFGSRIADSVRGVGDAIAKPFLSAYGKIEGFISSVVGLFAGFGSRVLASVSSMGGQILEKLLGGLPGPVRSALGFARGGVVIGPMMARVGESGPEAIVPLARPLSQVDPSVRLLSAIAQGKIPGLAAGAVAGGSSRVFTVAPGAIVVNTNVANPERVAESVVDRMTLALA